MSENGMARARRLAAWKRSIQQNWSDIQIRSVKARDTRTRQVGESFELSSIVHLGANAPQDVEVEIYYGPLDSQRQVVEPRTVPMHLEEEKDTGLYLYTGTVPCKKSGMVGYTVRVVPSHPDANNVLTTGLMTWWKA
jgi:starch phosphorylase